MPTGYTAKLMEKGQDFNSFVMTCARAFGALIDMRDSPLDAPIPKAFKPSPYATDALDRARGQRDRLEAMTNARRILFGKKERASSIKGLKAALARDEAENVRLDDMAYKVMAWTPPTAEHKELKAFMLDQIKISRHDTDYYRKAIKEAEEKSPLDYYAAAVIKAERDIAYYSEEIQKEEQRALSRTEWVRQLRGSLKRHSGDSRD